MTEKFISGCLILLFALSFIASVSAITATIGNAKMVLREVDGEPIQVGDEIEKYILVKNVNDIPVNIEIFASGDLAEYTTIEDSEFTLQPGENKKAYFTVKVAKSGTTETKINVQFSPTDKGSGAGLSSQVIVIAEDNGSVDDSFNDKEDSEIISTITGKIIGKDSKTNKTTLALFITGIVFIAFIVALILANNKMKLKREKIKPKKSAKK